MDYQAIRAQVLAFLQAADRLCRPEPHVTGSLERRWSGGHGSTRSPRAGPEPAVAAAGQACGCRRAADGDRRLVPRGL
jgi:hypothetical protein